MQIPYAWTPWTPAPEESFVGLIVNTNGLIKGDCGITVEYQTTTDTWTPHNTISGEANDISTSGVISSTEHKTNIKDDIDNL